MLFITNKSITGICLHTDKWLSNSIWHRDGTLTGTTTTGQGGPASNGNEGAFHIPQNFITEASPSDSLVLYPGHKWFQVFLSNTNTSV